MEPARILRLIVASVLGLVTLICAGCSQGEKAPDRQKLAEATARNEEVYRQYHDADYQTAKAALLGHIRFLDRLSAESADQSSNPYAIDAMVSYVRLAKLEERNNGVGKAEYMREASARCERLRYRWGDCSDGELRRKVDQMDSVPSR